MATRAQTPRSRLLQRSATGDAGAFKRKASAVAEEEEEGYEDTIGGYLDMAWRRIFSPILGYIGEIVGMVLQNAKPLLAYAIFGYLVISALIFGSGFLTNSINHALSPIMSDTGRHDLLPPLLLPGSIDA